MKLFEYQAKNILQDYQIPVSHGQLAQTADEASAIVKAMAGRAVIKAQVLTGGRGKAGGIKLVNSAEEAKEAASRILNLVINDCPVRQLLITPAVTITKELYVSVVFNRNDKKIDCVICQEGGIEIEEVAESNPEKIHILAIDPDILAEKQTLCDHLKKFIAPDLVTKLFDIIEKLYALFLANDCSLVEINPLAVDSQNQLIALDAKMVIDDNALFKHPELEKLKNPEEYSQDEIDAKNAGLVFIGLDGAIGCMVNGAGLAMATMDIIKHYGQEPANFLDIGGSSNPQKVIDGLAILMRNKKVKAVLLNIFGGITRCDDIANGLIEAQKKLAINVPLVIRLIGTRDKEGLHILQSHGLSAFSSLPEAVKEVIRRINRQGSPL